MTRIIVLTRQAFEPLAQDLYGRRYMNTELAENGIETLSLDAYGDWVAVPQQEKLETGSVVLKEELIRLVRVVA